MRRRLTVRTRPAGASVYVDKQLIGTSPISTSTTYYGTREIEVVGDGYRTERVFRRFLPPWYQIPPLDFFSETLWPWELRDERVVDITLVPYQAPASEVLQARADSLRVQSSQGLAVPLPSATPGFQPTAPPADFGPSGIPSQPVLPGPAVVTPPVDTLNPPGRNLGDLLQPPQRIPEAGILPGGGYRPELPGQ